MVSRGPKDYLRDGQFDVSLHVHSSIISGNNIPDCPSSGLAPSVVCTSMTRVPMFDRMSIPITIWVLQFPFLAFPSGKRPSSTSLSYCPSSHSSLSRALYPLCERLMLRERERV